jgi:uncharacterized cupredoxin-like copper-binding protein
MLKPQGRLTDVILIFSRPWHRLWAVGLLTLVLCFSGLDLCSRTVLAASVPLTKQPPIVKAVGLGNEGGDLIFIPNHLTFKAGNRYQLTLHNNSSVKHYFTAKDFADAIWSQKVDAGNVEVKGAIHELELRAGSQAEWVFIPLRAGIYSLRCTVPGHAEAGMVGTIEITG